MTELTSFFRLFKNNVTEEKPRAADINYTVTLLFVNKRIVEIFGFSFYPLRPRIKLFFQHDNFQASSMS